MFEDRELELGAIVFLVDCCYSSYLSKYVAGMWGVRVFAVCSSFGSSKPVPDDEVYYEKSNDVKMGSYFMDLIIAKLGPLLDDGGDLGEWIKSVEKRILERIPLRYRKDATMPRPAKPLLASQGSTGQRGQGLVAARGAMVVKPRKHSSKATKGRAGLTSGQQSGKFGRKASVSGALKPVVYKRPRGPVGKTG